MTEMEAPEQSEELSVSRILIEAREAKGLSQKDVADQLYLTATFIRYIDDGLFDKFPKQAFVKGYLRSYARVVSLNGDEIVTAYERTRHDSPNEPEIRDVTEERVGPVNFTGPVVQTGVIGLIAAIVVVAIVWWAASDKGKPAPVVTQPAVMSEPETQIRGETPAPRITQDSIAVNAAQAEADAREVEAAPVTETTTQAAEVASAVIVPPEPVPVAKEIQVERVKDGETTYITIYAGGDDSVELSFTDECWVEIEDGSGQKVYADLNRAGDVMTINGIAPFDVLLGRAPAVSMIYKGKKVSLKRFTTQEQTARVRTGRL